VDRSRENGGFFREEVAPLSYVPQLPTMVVE
jgi:hypothetical protein